MTSSPHIMLLDLYAGGHHGQYVRHLVAYWHRHALPGRLSIVAPPHFFDLHTDVSRAAKAANGVHCVPIDDPLPLQSGKQLSLAHIDRMHRRVARKYITQLRPDHCVFMIIDHVQLSLALDLRFPFPVHLSGIYFRPSFHYHHLKPTPLGWKDRLRHLRKRLLLSAALRNRHLTHLFCLDPYVIPHVEAMRRRVETVALPDGVEAHPTLETPTGMRQQWGVETHRRVALFFGSIAARKGIHQTLDALPLLPSDKQEQLCLVLVGAIQQAEKERIRERLQRVRETTKVQIVVQGRFVEEEEIPSIFASADLILLPYQRHLGSSGVLIRAALAGVPVLGSDYGLVGEHLRRHTLGMATDTTRPSAIATGIDAWLTDPDQFPFSPDNARRFAAENTAEHFAATLFQHVCPPVLNGGT